LHGEIRAQGRHVGARDTEDGLVQMFRFIRHAVRLAKKYGGGQLCVIGPEAMIWAREGSGGIGS
jgi:hypothetical protein